MDDIIQFKQVSKGYHEKIVFHQLNLTICKGKVTCIMGPSGGGKTTLLLLLLGLTNLDRGKILGLKGLKFSAVFQEDRLCEDLDALTNIKMVTANRFSDTAIAQEFEKVGITDFIGKPVSTFSGGMKRRVAIVRAMLAEYDLLVMDEPFKGLDESLKKTVIDYVKNKSLRKTIIMTTHDLVEAKSMGGEIIYLPNDGMCSLI